MNELNVITIGYAKKALTRDSREFERMLAYAQKLNSLNIIVFTRKSEGFSKTGSSQNLFVHPTNSISRIKALFDAWIIGKKILRDNPHKEFILSAQDPLASGIVTWLLALQRNTQLHIQVHGDYFSSYWRGKSLLRFFQQKIILFLLKRTKQIRVVSERIKLSLIVRGIEEEKITVLPIRPELEKFLEKKKVFTEHTPTTFLYVGRFAPEKDLLRMLGAFSLVYKKTKDIRLRLVGEGESRSDILKFIVREKLDGVVTVEGWTDDIPEVMVSADVLLLTSKHEAYGLVLLEAMATSLPVITTDVGCVGEIVKDGVHGIIVREDGVRAYADAIEKILSDKNLLEIYGKNGRKTAEELARQSMGEYVDEWVKSLTPRN